MLAKPASEVSKYDVVYAMEGDLQINRCSKDDKFCSLDATETCPVHDFLLLLQNNMIVTMSRKYIADFSA